MPRDAAVESSTAAPAALAALLGRLAQVAESGRDARELTEWVLRQVSQATGWPVAQALLVDAHGAVTMWFSSRNNETRWEAYTLTLGELAMRTPTGMLDRIITTRRPGWVSDIGGEADYPRAAAARSVGLRGTFAFPVLRGDQVVAVLQFLSPEPIEPDVDFQDAMRVAGHVLGAAFDKLRLDGESADRPSRLHRVMDAGDAAFLAVDADGRIAEWASNAERLFGWTRSEAIHRRISDLLLVPQSLIDGSAHHGPAPHRQEMVVQRRDGSTFPAEISHWQVAAGDAHLHDYLFCRDISERRQRSAGATRDPLTGLLNRAGMLDLLAERLARPMPPEDRAPVLMVIGLQRFKEVDYSTDHHVADDALRVIGSRLSAFAGEVDQRSAAAASAETTGPAGPGVRADLVAGAAGTAAGGAPPAASSVVARVSGDEFAILFDMLGGTTEISAVAEQAVDVIAVPFQAAGRRLAVAAHVGVAAPLAGSDAASWFGDADAALYRSRHGITGGRASLARFEIEGFARRQGASWRQNLPAEMQTALKERQFELYFQPVLTLPDRAVVGAEALIRWHHPQHGLLLPGSFIEAAEESGMIAPIGEWVMLASARQAADWRRAGADVRVAVNLSARQLADPGIVTQVANAVATVTAVDGRGGLVVEMTESVLMVDPAVAATRIGQFRDMGIAVAIDDFGTGYSSMAYLKWFEVDIIKIDMSFVRGMATSRTDAAIVRTIVDLTRELQIDVVAEGVETDAQLAMLTELGCGFVQGFGLGRPVPAAEFTARIGAAGGGAAGGNAAR